MSDDPTLENVSLEAAILKETHQILQLGALMRIWITVIVFLFCPLLSYGQSGYTTVTATVVDSNGSKYSNAPYTVTFFDPGTSGKLPLLSGSTFQKSYNGYATDGNGNLSISLPDNGVIASTSGATNTQWTFSICTAVGAFTTQFCIPATNITITGNSQNISATLTAVAPLLPTSGGGTINGTAVSGQVAVGTGPNTIGSNANFTYIAGQAKLIATANNVTPLVVNSFSISQSATMVDINNQSSGTADTPVVFRGRGYGSFTPSANPGIVHIIMESDATGHNALVITNHTADVAKGVANFSAMGGGVDDAGLGYWCAGGAVADGTNNYSCFKWQTNDAIIEQCGNTNTIVCAAVVPFSVRAAASQTADIFDILGPTGTPIGGYDLNGDSKFPEGSAPVSVTNEEHCGGVSATHALQCSYNNGTAFNIPQTICSVQVALSTGAIGSGARATNTGICTGLSTSTDTINCSFNSDTNAVTGYAPSASGGLSLKIWISTNTINVDQVNNTGGSITPGAATVNCKGIR